tara:strand:- start:639 stop:998 length:360 start_codon:yes stop_codon:yes gene_type:complete
MSESFLLALKWYVIAIGVMVGTSAFMISQSTNSMDPIIIGILGYGISYVLISVWKDFREKLLFASGAVFVAISLFAPYMHFIIFMLFDRVIEINEYYLWGLTMAFVGIPVMTIVFKFLQ